MHSFPARFWIGLSDFDLEGRFRWTGGWEKPDKKIRNWAPVTYVVANNESITSTVANLHLNIFSSGKSKEGRRGESPQLRLIGGQSVALALHNFLGTLIPQIPILIHCSHIEFCSVLLKCRKSVTSGSGGTRSAAQRWAPRI